MIEERAGKLPLQNSKRAVTFAWAEPVGPREVKLTNYSFKFLRLNWPPGSSAPRTTSTFLLGLSDSSVRLFCFAVCSAGLVGELSPTSLAPTVPVNSTGRNHAC